MDIEYIKFNVDNDVIDFNDLVHKVNSIDDSSEEYEKLVELINKNSNIFSDKTEVLKRVDNKINQIIDEYAENFEARLFRHTYDYNSKITLKNLYISPKYRCMIENKLSNDIISKLTDFLFPKSSGIDNNRILFIDGDAAIGKTSLVSWICYHYKKIEKDDIAKLLFSHNKLICIRLRDLDFTIKYPHAKDYILTYLNMNDEDFCNYYTEAVIILDGVDELSMVEAISAQNIEEFIFELRKFFKKNKIIITSRPKFMNMQLFLEANFNIQWICLEHFDTEMRTKWIRKYLNCGESLPESTQKYILELEDTTAIGVGDTPLALYLLASCNMKEEYKGNSWALYQEIFKNAISKTEYNENFSCSGAHPIKLFHEIMYQIVELVAKQMFKNSTKDRYYIDSKELNSIILTSKHNCALSIGSIKQCCVLCAYWKQNVNIGALEFYHNNIRDFFLCEYIYREIFTNLISYKQAKISENMFINNLCSALSDAFLMGTTWEQTLYFLYCRLKYELSHIDKKGDGIWNYLQPSVDIPKFVKALFETNLFSDETSAPLPYLAINCAFYNILIILKICFQIETNESLFFLWKNEHEKAQVYRSNILYDWSEMFTHRIKLSANKFFSLGNNLHLPEINFEYTNLNNSDFSNSFLENANFTNASLSNSYFTNANLKGAVFKNADLRNANFYGANLEDVNFDGANIEGCVFDKAKLKRTSWIETNMKSLSFKRAEFDNVTLERKEVLNVDFDEAEFFQCSIIDVSYSYSTLKKTFFCDCELNGINFQNNCILENIVFDTNTTLDRLNAIDCYFKNVRFENTLIKNTSFNSSHFFNAIFKSLNLKQVFFEDIRFDGVVFEKVVGIHVSFDSSSFFMSIFSNNEFIHSNMCNTKYIDKNRKIRLFTKKELSNIINSGPIN